MFHELTCKRCGWIWQEFNPEKTEFVCPCGHPDVEIRVVTQEWDRLQAGCSGDEVGTLDELQGVSPEVILQLQP